MQLMICEKPSVGATLAKALGANERKTGYFEGDSLIVSWCIGHLVELANADVYNERYKKWNIEDLPIIPQEWQFVISADKNEQFVVLRSLMNDSRVTEVVNACDAGREGELIFRLVYNKIGCTKPIKRLWLSSMEEKAIKKAFTELKDGKEYESLYRSALCRAKADWIVGINSTRLFSKMYNKKLSVGRVQTPTLAILLDREKAIADFKKEKYFTVHLKSDGLDAVSEKFTDEDEAKRIAEECSGKPATVKSVNTERKTVNPPKLYDLTTLQREANRLYGFTAQQTLDYTQSLYEMKLCTYPRTDSQYLTEDTMIQVYRGEVYLATLLGEGCEQKGTRPVLIVQNNVGNRFSPTTIIAPITSSIKKCSLPVHVPVFNSSLFKDSIVLCEQIQVMDKSRLEKPLCRLTDKEMKAVNKALAVSVGDYELPDKR